MVLIAVAVIVGGFFVVAIIGVLAAIAVPSFARARSQAQATMTLSNARQLQLAAMRMALDNDAAPDPALGWPGDLAKSPARPVVTVGDYIERLVEYKYLERADLPKLFAAPGIPAYTGSGNFDSAFSPFKIYRVRTADSGDCLFLATRNFTFGLPLDSATQPFGSKVGVVVDKGGAARVIRYGNEPVGHLPADADGDQSREELPSSILKM